jgi:hypothetical protein
MIPTPRRPRRNPLLCALALAAAAAPVAAGHEPDERASYSYLRTIEGRATLASVGSGPGEEADRHQILKRGDRLRVERGARLELVLADRNLLRVGGGSDLLLTRVAFSADGDDRTTRLDLERGELVLEVTGEALGDELPEIRTPSATIYVQEPGLYRVRAESDGYTELLVRSGHAELLTERGSTIVRAGEEAWTTGDRWRPVELVAAGPRDALERWSDELATAARRARERILYVEPELAYAAAPLADHGSWVEVDATWYWRPRVAVGWRPYWDGRWCWSPSGLTWVSYEPWGWVPYHYGTWCLVPGYGWAWRPGRVYSPAWVYWYWSDPWTGWCPIGYYTHFYRGHWATGFRWGVYGWCGGPWSFYSHWSFAATVRVCDRRPGPWYSGPSIARTAGPTAPNGILTTDTSGLPRDRWDRPRELVDVLERKGREGRGRDLPVVTDFVARKVDLPREVDAAVRGEPGERRGRRLGPALDPAGVAEERGRGAGRDESARDREPGWKAKPVDRVGRGAERADERRDLGRTERGGTPHETAGGERGAIERGERRSPPARGGDRAERATPPAANDRQGWRRDGATDDSPGHARGNDHAARPPRGSDDAPRGDLPPGSRWSQSPTTDGERPERGRGAPDDRSDRTERSGPPPPSGAQRHRGYPPIEIGGPAPPPEVESGGRGHDSRAGWRSAPAAPAPAPDDPVERVIGGVRRGQPDRGAPSGGHATPPPNWRPAAPAAPPAGWQPAPRAPRAPQAGGSGGAVAPPGRGHGGGRATPPPQVAPGPGRGPGGQHPSGGHQASPPPSRGSDSSSGSSSPPPKSKGKARGADGGNGDGEA